MRAFTYERAASPAEAAAAVGRQQGAKFIAGGTNLLDLMKLEIETPAHLIDVNGLAFDKIESTPEGGLRIGALVAEDFHAGLPATSVIASTIFEYAPQRQILPLMRSRNSSGVTSGFAFRSALTWLGMPRRISPSAATAEQIWPGVQ